MYHSGTVERSTTVTAAAAADVAATAASALSATVAALSPSASGPLYWSACVPLPAAPSLSALSVLSRRVRWRRLSDDDITLGGVVSRRAGNSRPNGDADVGPGDVGPVTDAGRRRAQSG